MFAVIAMDYKDVLGFPSPVVKIHEFPKKADAAKFVAAGGEAMAVVVDLDAFSSPIEGPGRLKTIGEQIIKRLGAHRVATGNAIRVAEHAASVRKYNERIARDRAESGWKEPE